MGIFHGVGIPSGVTYLATLVQAIQTCVPSQLSTCCWAEQWVNFQNTFVAKQDNSVNIKELVSCYNSLWEFTRIACVGPRRLAGPGWVLFIHRAMPKNSWVLQDLGKWLLIHSRNAGPSGSEHQRPRVARRGVCTFFSPQSQHLQLEPHWRLRGQCLAPAPVPESHSGSCVT